MATKVEFDAEIKQTIGGECLVDVELTSSDYDLCFKKAKRAFKQRGHNNFRHRFIALDVVAGVTTYDFSTADPAIDEVVKVISPDTGFSSSDDITNSLIYDSLFSSVGGSVGSGSCGCGGGGSTHFDLLTYELTMQRIENTKRYTINSLPFHWDRFTKEIVFHKTPNAAGKYFIDAYVSLTDDEYREIDWIVRWSIAEAKEIIGRAYRKFTSLPGPMGETSLGGAELVQEGKEEKELLNQELLEFVDGDIDYMQITFG